MAHHVFNSRFFSEVARQHEDQGKNPIYDRGFPLQKVCVTKNNRGNGKQHYSPEGNPLKFVQSSLCHKQATVDQYGTCE